MKKSNYISNILLILIILVFLSLTVSAEYIIQQGDKLAVSVWGHGDLSTEFTVGPDGNVSLPLISTVEVKGLSLRELSQKLTDKYALYIRDPQVNLQLIEYRQTRVMVLGEIRNPGTYQFRPGKTIMELLSTAGGPTDKAALDDVRLTRGNVFEIINLQGLVDGTSIEANYVLEDGDIIYIPEGVIEITVMGQVKNPGRYQLRKNLKINDLLAMAGGLSSEAALELEYRSEDSVELLEVSKLLSGNIASPQLADGDMIYVPRGNFKVSISGEIRNPGSYNWREGMRLSELLAFAGSHTENANLNNIRISRENQEREFVNYREYIAEGDLNANPLLESGDSIYIDTRVHDVSILGEVNRPGIYKWHDDLRLDSLLAQAGNQGERGDIERIRIMSIDGSSQTINLEDYFAGANNEANPLLNPGDTIKIEETNTIDWEKVFNFISGLNLIKNFLDISW